jgi:Cytochrome bd-type quinol oxidase, subunit 2
VTLLGALLVFLMFVQGGQSLLFGVAKNKDEKSLLVNAMGHKWEMTFTTLVTFGGAIFASFPLYYSTSFGGAYWLWMAILFLFVIQAVSFEFRNKAGNLLGAKTYEIFLFLNGALGTFLIGAAVGTFFTGAAFNMEKGNIADISAPVISSWANGWHGLDALANPFNLLLGVGVFLAARTLGLLYITRYVESDSLVAKTRKEVKITGSVFVVGFVVILVMLFTMTGYRVDPVTGIISPEKYKFLHNMIQLIWPAAMLLIGVLLVLYGLGSEFIAKSKYSFYTTGLGVVLAVWSLLICAGFNNTAYFVSTVDSQQSLTLYNSSSSLFTLKVMAYVSLFIPVVLLYMVWVWRKLVSRKVSKEELMDKDSHRY